MRSLPSNFWTSLAYKEGYTAILAKKNDENNGKKYSNRKFSERKDKNIQIETLALSFTHRRRSHYISTIADCYFQAYDTILVVPQLL